MIFFSFSSSFSKEYVLLFLDDNVDEESEYFHSHKKRKDSLEGSLNRVLLAAELEFPKILVPRLPQHTSNVNIECAGKSEWSKQQCSLHVASFLEH